MTPVDEPRVDGETPLIKDASLGQTTGVTKLID